MYMFYLLDQLFHVYKTLVERMVRNTLPKKSEGRFNIFSVRFCLADIKKDAEFRQHFQQMCATIGVDPLASSKGFWSEMLGVGDYYYELGSCCHSISELSPIESSISDHYKTKTSSNTMLLQLLLLNTCFCFNILCANEN